MHSNMVNGRCRVCSIKGLPCGLHCINTGKQNLWPVQLAGTSNALWRCRLCCSRNLVVLQLQRMKGLERVGLTCLRTHRWAASGLRVAEGSRILSKLMPAKRGYLLMTSGLTSSISARPTISSTFLNPMAAMCSRISSATMKKKLMACSGSPANLALNTGSCSTREVVYGAFDLTRLSSNLN